MLKITFTNLSGKVENKISQWWQHTKWKSSEAIKTSLLLQSTCKMSEAQDVYVYQSKIWKEAVVEKKCA